MQKENVKKIYKKWKWRRGRRKEDRREKRSQRKEDIKSRKKEGRNKRTINRMKIRGFKVKKNKEEI